MSALTTKDLPGHADLVWASFPCQDLSLAGAGAGLGGERSGTFKPFWKLVEGLVSQDRKPRAVVLENVIGTITSHRGKDFRTLVQTIVDSGYVVGAVVVNAVHFLPQSRPRLFVIAMNNEEKTPDDLTAVGHSRVWHPQSILKAYFDLPTNLKRSWVWWNLPDP